MPANRTFSAYVAILFGISVPFWFAATVIHGLLPKSIPIDLPFSALMTFAPAVAALVLLYRRGGWRAVGTLLARTFDMRRIRSAGWLVTAFLLMPAVLVASYVLMRLAGIAMPNAQVAFLMAPLLFGLFFVGAAGEELGWQGFAFGELEQRHSVLESALILGAVWAAWHIVPFFQTGHDATWVAWQCVVTLFLRVVTVWLYAYGGRSVFAAIVFHTMSNIAMFLFPNFGSYYDPATTAVVLAGVTAIMAAVWGPVMVRERVTAPAPQASLRTL